MSKHVIVKIRKINSVTDNMAYLANTKDHPEICYVYGTCLDKNVWKEYAAVNQKEFKASGAATKGYRCVEAREAIYIFPEEFYNLDQHDRERICREVADEFAKTHGVEVYAAMHGSDTDCSNLHVHIMYMERTRENRGAKTADRRLYFDDRGRQVKSRKYAVDESGNLLPGYSFVRKGETYGGSREWSAKNQYLHSNQFTRATKIWWANWLNQQRDQKQELQATEERLAYDRQTSPYLPSQSLPHPMHIDAQFKGLRRTAEQLRDQQYADIVKCNSYRRHYNDRVDIALKLGADPEQLLQKRKEVSEEIKKDMPATKQLIAVAIKWLDDLIRSLRSKSAERERSEGTQKPLEASQKAPGHGVGLIVAEGKEHALKGLPSLLELEKMSYEQLQHIVAAREEKEAERIRKLFISLSMYNDEGRRRTMAELLVIAITAVVTGECPDWAFTEQQKKLLSQTSTRKFQKASQKPLRGPVGHKTASNTEKPNESKNAVKKGLDDLIRGAAARTAERPARDSQPGTDRSHE